jgi:hypothetical protein
VRGVLNNSKRSEIMFGIGHRKATTETAVLAESSAKIGYNMPDGTVFAGISPDTHRPM